MISTLLAMSLGFAAPIQAPEPEPVRRIVDERLTSVSGVAVMVHGGHTVINSGSDGRRHIFFLDEDCKVSKTVAYPARTWYSDVKRARDTEDLAGRWNEPADTALYIADTGGQVITGAAASPDGKRVVLRTSTGAFQYEVVFSEVVKALTVGTPTKIPLRAGPQGETITYTADGSAPSREPVAAAAPARRWTMSNDVPAVAALVLAAGIAALISVLMRRARRVAK